MKLEGYKLLGEIYLRYYEALTGASLRLPIPLKRFDKRLPLFTSFKKDGHVSLKDKPLFRAISYWERYLRSKPEPKLWEKVGDVCLVTGDLEGALEAYRKGYDMSRDRRVGYKVASVALALTEYDLAQSTLKDLLKSADRRLRGKALWKLSLIKHLKSIKTQGGR